jgi:hypothetical protein
MMARAVFDTLLEAVSAFADEHAGKNGEESLRRYSKSNE